ncbi:DivIVA domain-containing protein [Curtobacterium sp. MCSS17_008]|uniref:DivIVA domain-containing protein n=1 Tax=Curtobacterium sp. MCSS17_008 TaxID=2175647 RepID=UPI000DA85FDA|nr:DivIVA domain-containing protein [Curtobacterium sp. MCSS17_008]PZF52893.1 DivIVA domain-containing protein [Curtobacterium sp. MCSS17_008]
MATTFPTADRRALGYDVDEVERFLEDARRAYTAGDTSPGIEAAKIRATAFSMRKGGYSTAHVDAALERLEDAFAAREREREIAEVGQKAWYAEARAKASDVVARLERPDGQRFARTSVLGTGYHPKEVDAFAERLAGYFRDGKPLSLTEVRSVVFRPKHGGYREAQVDALLDAVVEVMLAVR